MPQSHPCRVLLMIASMDGGGSERQTLLLLRHLSRERFSPELLVLRRGGSLYDQIPGDVPVHNLEEWTSRFRVRWPGRIYGAQVAGLKRLLVDRQTELIYDRTFHMTLIAAPAAAAVGVPRVSTIVSPPSQAVPQNAGKFLATKRRKLARAYSQAARVVAVSHPTAKDARRYYGLAADKIRVVPNPIDCAELFAQLASSELPARDSRYTIVCVGRMSQEKGHACLIRALDQLRQQAPGFSLPRVWMVGDGVLREQLEAMTARLDLSDCVQFIGHVASPAPWIAAADALCLPSRFEGFPNVMLEAMALGIPVIASDLDVVRSLGRIAPNAVDRGRDYVATFRDHDPAELARKIRRLRANPTATYSRMKSAKNLAVRAHAIGLIVPRIETIMLEARQIKAGE